jgi:hypothetical protein
MKKAWKDLDPPYERITNGNCKKVLQENKGKPESVEKEKGVNELKQSMKT